MRNFISKLFAFFFAAALCVGIICFSIERVSFDSDYHKEIVDRKYISSRLNMNDSQIDGLLLKITNYISGKEKSMQHELKGGKQLFNSREIKHMEDVKKLFKLCRQVELGCLAACIVLFIVLMILNGKYMFYYIARGCALFLLVVGVVLAGLLLWHYINFESFWNMFHKIAFNNDLWQMRSGDAIIIIYTLEFFTALVNKLIFRMFHIFGIVFACAVVGWVFLPKNRKGSPIVG